MVCIAMPSDCLVKLYPSRRRIAVNSIEIKSVISPHQYQLVSEQHHDDQCCTAQLTIDAYANTVDIYEVATCGDNSVWELPEEVDSI